MIRSEPELRRFGARVRDCRRALGWSQEQLAEECGMTRTYISHIELGYRNPTILNVCRLAAGLGVPVAELFVAEGRVR